MLADLLDRNTIRVSLFFVQEYQVEDGLSHNTPCGAPFKIVMALSGWVPSDGLNRYDGLRQ